MITSTKISRTKYLRLLEDDMKFCGLKDSTKHQYRIIIYRYLDFTDNNPNFSRQEIIRFISSLGNTTTTYQAWVLSIIKRFHKTIKDFLPGSNRNWPLGPRDGPKVVVRQQPTFDVRAINKLFRIIKNQRDYAMARLLFATGMRGDEICRVNISDYLRPNITIRMAKGEDIRTVRLDKETCNTIDNYLEIRNDRQKVLFLNDHSKPYTTSALLQVFKKYFNRAGFEKRTGLHAFRRGLVTLLYDRGMGETSIQKWGGWKTGEMVRRYIQLAPSKLGEEVISVHPFYEEE